jgi:hypothetical protein
VGAAKFLEFVIPTERVFCATEESAVALIGKGTASAVPRAEPISAASAVEVELRKRQTYCEERHGTPCLSFVFSGDNT